METKVVATVIKALEGRTTATTRGLEASEQLATSSQCLPLVAGRSIPTEVVTMLMAQAEAESSGRVVTTILTEEASAEDINRRHPRGREAAEASTQATTIR